MLTIPNILTLLRIFGTVCLLFTSIETTPFYIIYALSGFTDVLDGFIARTTKATTELGSKLDSIADLLLYAVMIIKLFPILWEKLPTSFWICILVILIIRAVSYISVAIRSHTFASKHTYLNKLTSVLVFGTPFLLNTDIFVEFCFVTAIISLIGSTHELVLHLKQPEDDENNAKVKE